MCVAQRPHCTGAEVALQRSAAERILADADDGVCRGREEVRADVRQVRDEDSVQKGDDKAGGDRALPRGAVRRSAESGHRPCER